MEDPSLDPRQNVDLPARSETTSRTIIEDGNGSGSEDEEAAKEGQNDDDEAKKKRRKLNLWKCRQCRESRKKCLPEDRVWPQKCERCIHHRPGELECSEPEMNTRTRGKNISKSKDKESTPAPFSTTIKDLLELPIPSRTASVESVETNTAIADRPLPITIKKIKQKRKDVLEDPFSEAAAPPRKQEFIPADVYSTMTSSQFRILHLEPAADPNDKIRCSFSVESIEDPPKYEAISYLWGGNRENQPHYLLPITLVDNNDPLKQNSILIRKNIHSALHALRHPTDTRPYWVDALCINRIDTEEKNRQVDMKKRIFDKAENLCFWLGNKLSYGIALSFVEEIIDLDGVKRLIDDPKAADKWLAFIDLLEDNIFSRLWLVQEVAIARNVTLHCRAPATVHYTDFVDAVTILLSCRKHILEFFRKRSEKHFQGLTGQKITIVERFVDITSNALRRDSRDNIERLLSLEALVSNLTDLSSGDSRDRIYSVLALAKDGTPSIFDASESTPGSTPRPDSGTALQIDYSKTPLQVYQEFFHYVTRTSKSLDIMCRRWAYSAWEDLPTWIRPIKSDLQLPFDSTVSERTDADSLVGIPNRQWYNAAKDGKAKFSISNTSQFHEKQSLTVDGFCLDTISRLGQRASEGFIFYEWLQLGGCKLGKVDFVPTAFWRTLVADRGPNGSNAPSWYHRALLYCLPDTPNGDIDTKDLIATCDAGSTLVVEFLQRVQSVIWNRKFLVSDSGLIGLAPMAAREGDKICILYGCSVPVVLRQKDDTFWEVVGECYVHGKMNGEAMENAPATPQKFELR